MVSTSTIRVDSYAAIRGYIVAALSAASITGVTTVTSFPKSNSDLPAVVIPMQTISTQRETLQEGSLTGTYVIEAGFDVYSTQEGGQGPAMIARIMDAIQDYMEITDLSSDNLIYEDIDSNNIVQFVHNEQTLYNAGAILTFKLTR